MHMRIFRTSDRSRCSDDDIHRTSDGVSVCSADLIRQVLCDKQNYSARGYNIERGRKCFGEIYLGLDPGGEYDDQSTAPNTAIQAIQEKDAFDLSIKHTRHVLLSTNRLKKVVSKVLAALSNHWFDLPNGTHVKEGNFRVFLTNTPRCPGDFYSPSGYIFSAHPGLFMQGHGQKCGHLLRSATEKFVAELKRSNKSPSGVLSRAVFNAFPGKNDLIARTLIGIMMGMLPTVYANLIRVVRAWRKDGKFAALQRTLKGTGGTDAYARAAEVLRDELIAAIRRDPVPEEIWRTATKDHTLGGLTIRENDKILISITSGAKGNPDKYDDIFLVFGGNRASTPHPTHACPGYAMAIGIMLGVINGLMEP